MLSIAPLIALTDGLDGGALAYLALALLLLTMGVALAYAVRQRRAQQALADSNNQLSAMVGAAGDGIVLVDVETGRFLAANPAICRMLDYSREEMLNLTIADIHPEEDVRKVASRFGRNATHSDAASIIDMGMRRKDGSIFLAQGNTAGLTLNGRRYRTAVFRDITAARASEQALKEAHAKLLALVAVLQRREREMTLLTRLHHLMLACNAMDEAYAIIASTAVDLFPRSSGALALAVAGKPELETVAAWGSDRPMLARFALDDCWALRTGQARDGELAGTKCRHFASQPNGAFICLPLTVHGETTGLLHLNVGPARAIDGDTRRLLDVVRGSGQAIAVQPDHARDFAGIGHARSFDRAVQPTLPG